ncbi:MAG: hypothetical protein ACJ75P_00260 [Gaiellaceae bacterium]
MSSRVLLRSALGLVLALALAPVAAADVADETALAEKYAPVVRLVTQEEECGPGEPYRPLDVDDVLFDEPTVALRGPWGGTDVVAVGPSAGDLAKGLYEYHLDFPGDALDPGCTYERWERRIARGTRPTVYAHVAADPGYPGKLALQYWFFYSFNDWNNKHEGDWEMVQLVFDAATPAAALGADPVEVGYSQHEGAERSGWDEDKLELVDGTHPVVHPAAGSHANYFGEALYLGSSAEQGVGCDDTSGPTFDADVAVRTIPSDPGAARKTVPWIEFEGRWGELQKAFFNGPTGPNLKDQWAQPILWTEGWRDRSYAVPAGGLLGTGATDFFCGAVEGGSDLLRRAVDDPLPTLLVLGALLALLLYAIARATWHPTGPLRVARRRTFGQTLAAAGRMYVSHLPLFLGIGLVLVPISLLEALLQGLVAHASNVAGIDTEGEGGGLLVLLVVAIGTALTLLGLGLVQAASARAVAALDEGRRIGPVGAYREGLARGRPLAGAFAIAAVAVVLLGASVVLIPIAIWLAIRWALIVPTVALEGLPAVRALRRSGRLVRRQRLKVASLVVLATALALASGPLVGALLILLTSLPFGLLNVVAGVVWAIALPFVALTTVYVYFDTLVRERLEPDVAPGELPAEIPTPG